MIYTLGKGESALYRYPKCWTASFLIVWLTLKNYFFHIGVYPKIVKTKVTEKT